MIQLGDCVEAMAGMDEASVDAICTDPPYMIGFMGKDFDSAATEPQAMQEWHHAWAVEARLAHWKDVAEKLEAQPRVRQLELGEEVPA